ncbi:Uncharacterised protein [Enterobacter cloacae]|nr:Uncharacterised protein [Enterobacter cloacae]VAM14322.1 Uncharacterised protein [Enterobacter kobei]
MPLIAVQCYRNKKNRRENPAAEVFQPGDLLIAAMAVFTPFFASLRCALRVIFEITPAMLATFTACF